MTRKSSAQLDREIAEVLDTRKRGSAKTLTKSTRQGPVFYRGTVPGDTRRIATGAADWDSYLFVTDTPENARWYGPSVEEVILVPEARILYEGTRDFTRVAGRWKKGETLLDYASHAARQARAAGYDAVHFKSQTDVGTAIMRREAVAARHPYEGA
jgi:hypothetical protein